MESARKCFKYSACCFGLPSLCKEVVEMGADLPVPRWSMSITRNSFTASPIHPPVSSGLAHSNPGPPWRKSRHGLSWDEPWLAFPLASSTSRTNTSMCWSFFCPR
eukprot:scaffold301_cov370-Pavlova_lutheri.AAC.14